LIFLFLLAILLGELYHIIQFMVKDWIT